MKFWKNKFKILFCVHPKKIFFEDKNRVGKVLEKWEHCTQPQGMCVGTGTDENSMAGCQKLKIKLPCDSTISILAIYPKENKSVFLIFALTCHCSTIHSR